MVWSGHTFLGIIISLTIETIERECDLEFPPNPKDQEKSPRWPGDQYIFRVWDKPQLHKTQEKMHIYMNLLSKSCLILLISMLSSSCSWEFLLPIMSLTQQLLIYFHIFHPVFKTGIVYLNKPYWSFLCIESFEEKVKFLTYIVMSCI